MGGWFLASNNSHEKCEKIVNKKLNIETRQKILNRSKKCDIINFVISDKRFKE